MALSTAGVLPIRPPSFARTRLVAPIALVAWLLVYATTARADYARTLERLASGAPVRIVCLGDSVTGVYYHTGGRRAYTDLLGDALRQAFPAADLTMVNAGISGNTTRDGLARLQADVLAHEPTLVTIMFGLNDVLRVPLEEYRENLRQLVSQCQAAGAEVLLCTPNNYLPEADETFKSLAEFCQAVRDLGQELHLGVADCFADLQAFRAEDSDAWRLLMSDAIHPNLAGHAQLAGYLAEAICQRELPPVEFHAPMQLAHTQKRLSAGGPLKVLAMTPFDQGLAEALQAAFPSLHVQVTPWPTAGLSIPQLAEDARQRVRAFQPDLVLLAVPADAEAADEEEWIKSFTWVMNWSLSFGTSEWDCVVVAPEVANPNQHVDGLPIAYLVRAQDLLLIDRPRDDARDGKQLLADTLKQAIQPAALSLIPWPPFHHVPGGSLILTPASRLVCQDPELVPLAEILQAEIQTVTGWKLEIGQGREAAAGDIHLKIDIFRHVESNDPESYDLEIADHVELVGGNYAAVAMASVTLLQSIRHDANRVSVPRMTIYDEPHFAYRGTLLDVARKPHSIETLKRCIQVCRYYKIRYLVMHLSDENAWTFPSTAFPELGSQNFAWAGGDAPTVYPLADLRELVAFADRHGVTLVPELEMPGHSGQLRGTLPEIFGYRGADGQRVSLGVLNMAGESAYAALDTLIGEMCDVFRSSPYIHIGCDEASLGGVAEMPEVIEYAAQHGLADPNDIFNHFVGRMHASVVGRGKRMIVWEGAPTGPQPLPADIVFMPWIGGTGAATDLVRQGFDVINSPWGTQRPYFDPFHLNGAQLAQDEKRLLGATSIFWQAEEQDAVPNMRYLGALRNEPAWLGADARDYHDFLERLADTDRRLDHLLDGFTLDGPQARNVPTQTALARVFEPPLELNLTSVHPAAEIHYTLDGSNPTAASPTWSDPLVLSATTRVKAGWFPPGGPPPRVFWEREFRRNVPAAHAAVGAAVAINPSTPGYYGPGAPGLTDGLLAAGYDLPCPGWVGWVNDGRPVEITVDLGKTPPDVTSVRVHCLRAAGGVALPERVEFLVSDDLQTFRPLLTAQLAQGQKRRGWYGGDTPSTTARYLRVLATPGGDWTFLDEVLVNGVEPAADVQHASVGCSATLAVQPNAYDWPGVEGLTDGYVSGEANFLSPEWLGFESRPFEATLDLGREQPLTAVVVSCLQDVGAGIFVPSAVEILVSEDGREFESVTTVRQAADAKPKFLARVRGEFAPRSARYVRVRAASQGTWLFVDEVLVE